MNPAGSPPEVPPSPLPYSEEPKPARPSHLLHALIGPALMVTVGSLFAIEYAGGQPFSRTWPALLIVFGVLRLMSFRSRRTS